MDSDEELEELRTKVAELTAQVDELTSRRRILQLAGAAVAGSAAAMAGRVSPALAADPNDLVMGQLNQTNLMTRADLTALDDSRQTGFFFQLGQEAASGGLIGEADLPLGSALAGRSGLTSSPVGVLGVTEVADGFGVLGTNEAEASGDGAGVRGEGGLGLGVKGVGYIGVEGSGYFGVRGKGSIGVIGLATTGGTAIYGTGGFTGIQGNGADVGLLGSADASGTGVRGIGGSYGVAALNATKANLFLQSKNESASGAVPKMPPMSRTDAHLVGELDNVDGELWWCVAAGTPGIWRRLAGTRTAGAYHAVTPGRVYDSRAPLPTQGPLAAGASRLVTVGPRRHLQTGGILAENFVPPGATALSCNVTVANTVGSGFLAINPGGDTTVNAATINWSQTGQILNNGVMLTLNEIRELTVIAGGAEGASTDFVLDVTGYFA